MLELKKRRMCPYPRMILLKAHQCELVDTNNKLLSLNDRGRQSFSEVEKVASLTTGWERSSWGTKKGIPGSLSRKATWRPQSSPL